MHDNLKLEPYPQDDGDGRNMERKSENGQGGENAPQMFELIAGEKRTVITLFRAGALKGYKRLQFIDMGTYSLQPVTSILISIFRLRFLQSHPSTSLLL